MKENPVLDSSEIIWKKKEIITKLEGKWINVAETSDSVPIVLAKYNDIYSKLLKKGIKSIPWQSYFNTNPFMDNNMCRLVVPKDTSKYDLLLSKIEDFKI